MKKINLISTLKKTFKSKKVVRKKVSNKEAKPKKPKKPKIINKTKKIKAVIKVKKNKTKKK